MILHCNSITIDANPKSFKSYLTYLLPTLILIGIFFISIFLSTKKYLKEKELETTRVKNLNEQRKKTNEEILKVINQSHAFHKDQLALEPQSALKPELNHNKKTTK